MGIFCMTRILGIYFFQAGLIRSRFLMFSRPRAHFSSTLTVRNYFAATEAASSLAALAGLTAGGAASAVGAEAGAGGTTSLAGAEAGAGAAGLSTAGSVLTGAAPVAVGQH